MIGQEGKRGSGIMIRLGAMQDMVAITKSFMVHIILENWEVTSVSSLLT